MKAYQFLKYNDNTTLERLMPQSENTVLCFDLEDSIQDCRNPKNTPALKATYRKRLKNIFAGNMQTGEKINCGIRINATESKEYPLDLMLLSEIGNITSVFIPKVSDETQILKLQNDLLHFGVTYSEIVPVVETKSGMNNLVKIAEAISNSNGSIAFGHCDYNFDNHIFPFFHQDSREYWTWIKHISDYTRRYRIRLINSPFLQLNNTTFFKHNLNLLNAICGDNVGQITLTNEQTALCNSFRADEIQEELPRLPNRLNHRAPPMFAENLITQFNEKLNEKGFAINNQRVVLSPQEYASAINYQYQNKIPEINFVFTGGCFPVQGNIPFEDLFHQQLKRKCEEKKNVKFNINIIRYERYLNCFTKIKSVYENQPFDILVFSLRPEPFLRLVKLYYTFTERSSGRRKWSINLPFLNLVNPEKYDLLILNSRYNLTVERKISRFRKMLININYRLGGLFGNKKYSMKKYTELVNEIVSFCDKNKIKLIILGPPINTLSSVEINLIKELDAFVQEKSAITQDQYISGSDFMKDNQTSFISETVFVNEKYHEIIANKISERIMPVFKKFNVN